jgi:AcrB/AcrD/AcrF family
VAADAVRNQALNSIGNTGNSTASTGSAVSTNSETMIPLSAVTHFGPGNIPLAVNHQGLAVATTISFNLAPGAALSDAVREVNAAMNRLGVPASLHGTFQGTARAFEQSIANEPYLVLAAVIAVYIVLGILYESYIHPITILSTLPSAGVGAVLALMLFQIEFSVIGLIGVILLIGIVKKNAIMMIDFALAAERSRGLTSQEAIFEASLLRLRPIMMTTAAAMLGAMRAAGETDYDVDRRVLPDDRDELLQFLSHQLERDALVSLDAAVETSSVLLREKALRHCDEQVEVEAEGCDKGHEDEKGMVPRPGQAAFVATLKAGEEPLARAVKTSVVRMSGSPKQQGAHHRGGGKGHHERNHDGHRQSHGKFPEQTTDNATHRQDRNEHGDQRDAHRQHRETNFGGPLNRGSDARHALFDVP